MPRLAKYAMEAWIVVDDARLNEFKVDYSENEATVSCWIPSEEGKSFTVHIRHFDAVGDILCKVKVDGRLARTLAGHQRLAMQYMEVESEALAKLTFGRVTLTENDNDPIDDVACSALGRIEVRAETGRLVPISSTTSTEQKVLSSKRPRRDVNWHNSPVHESLKKDGYHRVIPGDIGHLGHTNDIYKAIFVPKGKTVPLTFIFNYRSFDILRALEIVPSLHLRSAWRHDTIPSNSETLVPDLEVDEWIEEPGVGPNACSALDNELLILEKNSRKLKRKIASLVKKQQLHQRTESPASSQRTELPRSVGTADIIDLT